MKLLEGRAKDIYELIEAGLKKVELACGRQVQKAAFIDLIKLMDKEDNNKIVKGLAAGGFERNYYYHSQKAVKEGRGDVGLRFSALHLNSLCQFVHKADFESYYGCFRDGESILRQIEKRPDEGLFDSDANFLEALSDLGITGTTSKLTNSQFEPAQCMASASQSLFFMGILGSKWVENLAAFEEFVAYIQSKNGTVRFLMINPNSQSFIRLRTMRGGNLKDSSSEKFKQLVNDYRCLQVRFYNFIPSFRLIFMDSKLLAVSRYKLDKKGYFQSKQGWDAPHLVVDAASVWSMYEPFLAYYNYIWDSAKDIHKVIKSDGKE